MKNILFIGCLLLTCSAFSQLTGRQNYEKLGISFTIPDGWYGQETNEGLILGSNTKAGLVLLATHNYTLQQLRQEAENGINEGNGTVLRLSTSIESISQYAMADCLKEPWSGSLLKLILLVWSIPMKQDPV